MNLYELKEIAHAYNGRQVLGIDHWQAPERCIVGLYGPNGSGKSTLLKLLAFVQSPTSGSIFFEGRQAAPFSRNVRTRVALLPQDSYLFRRTVFANVAYGLRIRKSLGFRKKETDHSERVHQALNWVGLPPATFAQRPWFALSGGEARRVALAARLCLQPRVLLLDEPTSSVDAGSAQLIREAVLQAHSQWGTALIIASHDMQWLQEICDRTLHLYGGRIMGSGQSTLIFGPWRRHGDSMVARQLARDQDFIAVAPKDGNGGSTAVIDADQLSLYPQSGENRLPDEHRLQGKLVRLSFDNPSGCVSAAVVVGRTTLNLLVTVEHLTGGRYTPGSTVWVGYQPRHIQWHTPD